MAEFYGEKPKRFSREWWPYFWLYYKWHTIGIAVALLIITTTVVDIINRERYDLEIVYLGSQHIAEESLDNVTHSLTDAISDADGNGEREIIAIQLNVADGQGSIELTSAYRQKRDLELSTNKYAYMYIYTKPEAESILSLNGIDSLYQSAEKWYNGDLSEVETVYANDGKPYAISLKNSSILKENDIDSENLFVMIKNDEYCKEKSEIALNNAVSVANKLVK